jgi:hypothetical protein
MTAVFTHELYQAIERGGGVKKLAVIPPVYVHDVMHRFQVAEAGALHRHERTNAPRHLAGRVVTQDVTRRLQNPGQHEAAFRRTDDA